MTPLQAIYAKCLECCCDQLTEVKNCTVTSCPLYEYHTRVKKRLNLSDEQREKLRQRAKNTFKREA